MRDSNKSALIFLLYIFTINAFLSGEELVFSLGIPEGHFMFSRIEKFFTLVEKRVEGDLELTIRSIPYARAKDYMIQGLIDGDIGRTDLVYRDRSDIIQLEPPLIWTHFYPFGKQGLDFSDTKSYSEYRFIVQRGAVFQEDFLIRNNLEYMVTGNLTQAFGMLSLDRGQVVIASPIDQEILETGDFQGSGIFMYPQILFSKGLYLYIHRNKVNWIPAIETVLLELEEEGLIDNILLENSN